MSDTPVVLHVVPTTAARGAQREARALADRLDQPGVRRHRLVSLRGGDGNVAVDAVVDGRPVLARLPVFDPTLVLRLRRLVGAEKPAVVVAHGADPLKYLVPAVTGSSLALLYYATGLFGAPDSAAHVWLWRRLLRRADMVAAEGAEVLEQCRVLLGVPPSRSAVAPNGRDTTRFHPPLSTATQDPPGLAVVGALSPEKRPRLFVDVVYQLRRRVTPLRALMCGDGPMRAELDGPAAEAGVELLGARDDVDEVLRGADVLLFTGSGDGEGMPGVLIEAALSAVPVVTTGVAGVGDIVLDGRTGLVVDGEVEALADAVASLLADPEKRRRLGTAARSHCESRFSLDAVVACWLGLLEPLLKSAGPAQASAVASRSR